MGVGVLYSKILTDYLAKILACQSVFCMLLLPF